MIIPEWFHDPRIKEVAPEKLQLLLQLAKQLEGKKDKREIMPILMGAVVSANKQNLQFSPEEFELIFSLMKDGKSDAEKQQMDEMRKKAQKMKKSY